MQNECEGAVGGSILAEGFSLNVHLHCSALNYAFADRRGTGGARIHL